MFWYIHAKGAGAAPAGQVRRERARYGASRRVRRQRAQRGASGRVRR